MKKGKVKFILLILAVVVVSLPLYYYVNPPKTEEEKLIDIVHGIESFISQIAYLGIKENEIKRFPLTDNAKQDLIALPVLRPAASQWVGEIPLTEKPLTIAEFLALPDDEQSRIIYNHRESIGLNFEHDGTSGVTSTKSYFTRFYFKDELAYIFVKASRNIQRMKVNTEWLEVEEANLYRGYLFQKVKGKWMLQELKEMGELKYPSMSDLEREATAYQVDKFMRSFGEKAGFDVE